MRNGQHAGPPRRACPYCNERDIPTVGVQWLWWERGAPIHPWCSPVWKRLTFMGKRGVRRMVDQIMRQAADLA